MNDCHNYFLLPAARIGDEVLTLIPSTRRATQPSVALNPDREALCSSSCFCPFSTQVATSFISCQLLLSTGTIRLSPSLLAPNTERKTLTLDSYTSTPTSNSLTRARTTTCYLKRRIKRRAPTNRVFRLRLLHDTQGLTFHSICAGETVRLGRKPCDEIGGGSAGRLRARGVHPRA